jgi:hypothetical protein
MADSAGRNPESGAPDAERGAADQERGAADKERSRQLSRPVSGKEAARSVGQGSRPSGRQRRSSQVQGQGVQDRGRRAQERQREQAQGGRGSSAPRQAGRHGTQPAARRPSPRRARQGRSRASLFVWGAIGLVVVIVGVIVGVSQTSSTTTKGAYYPPRPVPATVLREITHVPVSAFNAVGTGIPGTINVPTVHSSNKLLTSDGKPEVFGLFGEFCPYCAAERWAIITSLSRFGTFSGLRTMQSAPVDVYPRTQTFEFNTAKYTSPYITAKLLELYGQDKPTGSHSVINTPTKQEVALIKKFDSGSGTTRSGTIPFSDWGNRVIFSGASFNPNPLQGLSRTTIAASLHDPRNPITKLILGTSNYISAAVCYIDGGKPASVCTSPGVEAAAKALKVSV